MSRQASESPERAAESVRHGTTEPETALRKQGSSVIEEQDRTRRGFPGFRARSRHGQATPGNRR